MFITLTKRLILTLTTSLVLLFSSFSIDTGSFINPRIVEASTLIERAVPGPILSAQVATTASSMPGNLESYVRAYFVKTPILAEVSRCESRFRQYAKNGEVMRGVVEEDVGLMQINEYFHKSTAEKLGYNLATIDGNLGYAKYLYEREGTQPWSASAYCWSK